MFTRSRSDVEAVNWGNGTSERLLTLSDSLGFTVAHTIVRAGTRSALQYRNHLEACYCIAGRGVVESEDGTRRFEIIPGTLYALDEHDRHFLIASDEADLELVSIFNPPLSGHERHVLDAAGFSSY
ncbi:ectoine synthase [Microbacterium imperiale]|uniref:L-ectoine synthase n=1 Tax=Microbacterium imperiale TaxID=33884 RepID=A0A9W6HE86_9MICO|nr:ectoine synthase [Microbacterium imperiale]MBP2419971.1 L-ectoine synthase [Microbacterium imperiale]MDS0198165.1 ectoine synthase [Microbacterium imperiale]BFE40311.1 ectoine synthase [Microbacterium imperiale]GLJ78712.1 L-ectoine synthase [Microbacterium imperiale]